MAINAMIPMQNTQAKTDSFADARANALLNRSREQAVAAQDREVEEYESQAPRRAAKMAREDKAARGAEQLKDLEARFGIASGIVAGDEQSLIDAKANMRAYMGSDEADDMMEKIAPTLASLGTIEEQQAWIDNNRAKMEAQIQAYRGGGKQDLNKQPEETWGAPVRAQSEDGRSVYIRTSNLGNQKEVEGFSPYKQLSTTMEKELMEAQNDAIEYESNANRSSQLADIVDENPWTAGTAGGWIEGLKSMSGQRDYVSQLRTKTRGLINSAAIQNLPPGVASDKDIEIAMKGFPPENADSSEVSSYLRGLAKMDKLRAEYQYFKSDYISNSGRKNTAGMLKAWKSHVGERSQGDSAGQVNNAPQDQASLKSERDSNRMNRGGGAPQYKEGQIVTQGGNRFQYQSGEWVQL